MLLHNISLNLFYEYQSRAELICSQYVPFAAVSPSHCLYSNFHEDSRSL